MYILLIKNGNWVGFAIFVEYKREREKATEENRRATEESRDGCKRSTEGNSESESWGSPCGLYGHCSVIEYIKIECTFHLKSQCNI